jgi:uncharacterized protein YfbU (UPF0304 family)
MENEIKPATTTKNNHLDRKKASNYTATSKILETGYPIIYKLIAYFSFMMNKHAFNTISISNKATTFRPLLWQNLNNEHHEILNTNRTQIFQSHAGTCFEFIQDGYQNHTQIQQGKLYEFNPKKQSVSDDLVAKAI